MLRQLKYKFRASNAYADARSEPLDAGFTIYHNRLVGRVDAMSDTDGGHGYDDNTFHDENQRTEPQIWSEDQRNS